MAPDSAKEKSVDKLRKLLRHKISAEELGSEAEAAAFAEKIRELLARHQIDMSDVELERDKETNKFGFRPAQVEDYGLTVRSHAIPWMEAMAAIVARAHFCKLFLCPRGTSRPVFFGREHNTLVCEQMFGTLASVAESIATKEYVKYFYECRVRGDVKQARGFRKSFLMGFVKELGRRYDEQRERMSSEFLRDTRALARLSGAHDETEAEAARFVGKTIKRKGVQVENVVGYARGVGKAGELNIGGPAITSGKE